MFEVIGSGLVFILAIEHLWFFALEMFLWQKPVGLRLFAMTPERAQVTSVLAANQGLYNGFLAAGLIWSLVCVDPLEAWRLRMFFLGCVAVAGVYGGYSVSRRIFILQGLPAILALLFLGLAKN